MKKLLSVFIALVICTGLIAPAYAADNDIHIDKTWCVLVSASPSVYETFAAGRLSEILSEALGADIPVVSSAEDKYIAVGSASKADLSKTAENGYRITAAGGNVHIGGTGARGLQAGVYRFAEQFCKRKVYTSDIIELPEVKEITVPAGTDVSYNPFFEYTDTDWKSPTNAEYSMANGLTGGTYRAIPDEAGGTVNYLGGFCHTMGTLCETAVNADSHPEQLALHDGKRTIDQPCLMNPDVLAIATKNVLALLKEKHNPDASLQIVSVTQNDNYNYCECEKCRAFEKAHGGVQSATMLNFVNQIADAVKAAGYKNVAIDTFAYQYTRSAPENIVPRDNVIVRLCTIECCFCHALDNPKCECNVKLMKDLKNWSAICRRIYIWDYTTNYANTCIVFPDFDVIQRNIQVFYENNVKGVYEEGNYYMSSCDTEFGELRSYMISKCLQNPYCDLESEVNGFLRAYYGPGWENIKLVIDKHIEHAGGDDGHLSIGDSPYSSVNFTSAEVSAIDSAWASAYKAAETDMQKNNIRRSELSWRFWKASTDKSEFSLLNPERYNERQKLFDDLKDHGVQTISEGGYGDYLDCICVRYAPANEWNMYEADESGAQTRLFFGRILEALTPLLSAFGLWYKIFS